MTTKSEITNWYRGKVIFITGATGFIGKILVETLLRRCPEIDLIYILVRDKKKLAYHERVDELLSSPVFDDLLARREDLKEKIITIPGDMTRSELGISAEDKSKLQKSVSVVFHVAATVRFDESLRLATAINVEGTRSLLQLAKGMRNLRGFVHVSTAYSNCTRSVIEERIYEPPIDPKELAKFLKDSNDDIVNRETFRLIADHPNTYTYTKAIAEGVIAEYANDLPIVVTRPSIVTAAWKPPYAGRINSFDSPTIIMAAASKGMLRYLYGDGNLLTDMMPVDTCVNMLIAAAWEIGSRSSFETRSEVLVYNCVSGPSKPQTWYEFVKDMDHSIKKYRSKKVFPRPALSMTHCRTKYAVAKYFYQTLPAIITDLFSWLFGFRPKMRFYQNQISKLSEVVEFFLTHEWQFRAQNVERLHRKLNHADRELFNFDLTEMDWKSYNARYFIGIREKTDTEPKL